MNAFRRLCVRVVYGLAVTATLCISATHANEQVFKKTLHGTVLVLCKKERGMSVGSGILVDAQKRLVATANHVVADGTQVVVVFPVYGDDGNQITEPDYYRKHISSLAIRTRVVARSASHDLALLRLARIPTNAQAVLLAKHAPRAGQDVHGIGNSGIGGGALWRYSPGKVRNVYHKRWRTAEQVLTAQVVETSLPANPGDSGGPVVNDQAELVAITSGFDPSSQAVSIGIEVRELSQLLQEPPAEDGHADDGLLRRARQLKSAKQYRLAAVAYVAWLEEHRRDDTAWAELAWVCNELKEYDAARLAGLKAIDINGRNAAAWREVGFALIKKGVYDKAVLALQIAVRLDSTDRSARQYLAEARRKLAQQKGAASGS